MAGHSQWANRKHRKARQDAKKGKIFSKMAREITMAARMGGGDPDINPRLRAALEKARQFGVPNENIERAIKRGTGELEGAAYEELMYEGYGPGGVALMVRVVTDNRNRAAGEIRHIFSKHGGSLGEKGSVAWQFERKGLITIDRASAGVDEETLMMAALEADAEDVRVEGDVYEIITAPEALEAVRQSLEAAGVTQFNTADVTLLPQTQVRLEGREAEQLLRLLDALEDHDDVQEVYGNYDIAEEVMAAFGADA
ncbi:MAG: YebC/PmpR family DNA-binding transcriptional regulator [Bacillota bacterium]|nr:YebC/PmpR family DNA-binding transcriptional regulator [Bacillota bacterium]